MRVYTKSGQHFGSSRNMSCMFIQHNTHHLQVVGHTSASRDAWPASRSLRVRLGWQQSAHDGILGEIEHSMYAHMELALIKVIIADVVRRAVHVLAHFVMEMEVLWANALRNSKCKLAWHQAHAVTLVDTSDMDTGVLDRLDIAPRSHVRVRLH